MKTETLGKTIEEIKRERRIRVMGIMVSTSIAIAVLSIVAAILIELHRGTFFILDVNVASVANGFSVPSLLLLLIWALATTVSLVGFARFLYLDKK